MRGGGGTLTKASINQTPNDVHSTVNQSEGQHTTTDRKLTQHKNIRIRTQTRPRTLSGPWDKGLTPTRADEFPTLIMFPGEAGLNSVPAASSVMCGAAEGSIALKPATRRSARRLSASSPAVFLKAALAVPVMVKGINPARIREITDISMKATITSAMENPRKSCLAPTGIR